MSYSAVTVKDLPGNMDIVVSLDVSGVLKVFEQQDPGTVTGMQQRVLASTGIDLSKVTKAVVGVRLAPMSEGCFGTGACWYASK